MMATLEPATRFASQKRAPSNYSVRTLANGDNTSSINGGSIGNLDENRNPPSVPKELGGMLKTTTETGDIGLFSIKPSRVPLSVNNSRRPSGPQNDDGMRRPRQFQPYGVPYTDDRRRLPSYARDTSSEVISMYETSSQKSGSRVFDDPDHRSYSLTQTYSSYSLSNHRSYASLRSQPEAGGLLQRPRSPFAYPARLKRPGFRPSSPALTDGGGIDYSRRAEINRTPHTAHAPSTTTTPGKIPPPSPLYYDYTEDFDVVDSNQADPLEPPPQFRVERTIPEDRPLSSGWMSLDGADMPNLKPNSDGSLRNPTSAAPVLQVSQNSSRNSTINNISVFDTPPNLPTHEPLLPAEDSTEKSVAVVPDRKTIRLSGLGLGARELSTHVEEVFGLQSTASFEVPFSDNTADDGKPEYANADPEEHAETQSTRNSSHSLGTHLRRFPPPPNNLDHQSSETDTNHVLTFTSLNPREVSHSSFDLRVGEKESIPLAEHTATTNAISPFPPHSSSSQSDRKLLSHPTSIDDGLTELNQVVNAFEEANRTKSGECQIQDSYNLLPEVPPNSPNGSLSGNGPSVQRFNFPPSFYTNQSSHGTDNDEPRDQGPNINPQRHRLRRLEAITVPTVSENDVPNFSHQFPRKLMSRSESPMLAPKPISPARQLRLKNSVPQLMKALPALPPDLQLGAGSPPLPCFKRAPIQEAPRSAATPRSKVPDTAVPTNMASQPVEINSVAVMDQKPEQAKEEQTPPTPPPKLKLKTRSSLQPTSPMESRPWNSENSYPWSSQPFSVGLPTVIQEVRPDNTKRPKFKLKITRAANSTVGTVRVNRESAESRSSEVLQLRRPKDLFTPSSGIENIFRRVSKHLHSRKSSASSSHPPTERRTTPNSAPISDQIALTRSLSSRLSAQPSQTSLKATSATEVRSFFSDDSSHRRVGGRRLGNRISNFRRARIGDNYGAANGTQSHDDITWRTRNRQEALLPAASASIPNLHARRAGHETKRPRLLTERMHAQNIRRRFTRWFKGARSAIRARVKSRKMAERGDDEQVELTA
ncbi:hypothetical protein D0Z07_2417 [Hyphodiscus hymeniophilus]|uniref:Uncharacterized protein n=1 Tax=Hyphodiscus hymeniophilus TaxID=353542 RepID=A0A9P7AZK4_9HELO|nr:hypothetical protein D0Z07_2417 [Hyphodiscus hymeniophilus]